MLGQRRRRLTNIKPALGQHIVFAGNAIYALAEKHRVHDKNIAG